MFLAHLIFVGWTVRFLWKTLLTTLNGQASSNPQAFTISSKPYCSLYIAVVPKDECSLSHKLWPKRCIFFNTIHKCIILEIRHLIKIFRWIQYKRRGLKISKKHVLSINLYLWYDTDLVDAGSFFKDTSVLARKWPDNMDVTQTFVFNRTILLRKSSRFKICLDKCFILSSLGESHGILKSVKI